MYVYSRRINRKINYKKIKYHKIRLKIRNKIKNF